ncbi:MAG: diguanylate cyclase [Gammaproteobacteria bacterium]|nr:diguanylate cyclase [Gammaproteobacteria bacterium]
MRDKPIDILLVEDSPTDALLLRESLSDEPNVTFRTAHVESLAEALRCLQDQRFDLILLDLGLPDSQGLETFVRVHEHVPQIPIVVLTGLDDDVLALKAVQEGAQDFLTKGRFDRYWLVRNIRHALERHQMYLEVHALSLTDGLTGLYNRRGFITLAEQQLKVARHTERGLILLYADLDHLKYINDTYGHQEGDRALVQAADILERTFRASDILGRIGGDEFAALAVRGNDETVQAIPQRLQKMIQERNATGKWPYELSISIGAMHFDPNIAPSVEEMMTKADRAMYEQKRRKRRH